MGGIIIYDGVCALCASVVQFVLKRDPHKFFQFVRCQSRAALPYLQAHSISQEDALKSFVVLPHGGGAALRRSAAALYIGENISGPWRHFAYLAWFIPTFARDSVYDCVARRRYAWFGTTENCLAPTRRVLDRFLDAEEVVAELKRKNKGE